MSVSPDLRRAAKRALACLDLTSLNLDDTDERIAALCDRALQPGPGIVGRPAAVCVYPRFARVAAERLAGSGVRVAVVANFPGGDAPAGAVVDEVEQAIADGAHEIDVVLPYRTYLAGRRDDAVHVVALAAHACHQRAHPATLKVILETGVLAERAVIVAAGHDVVDVGAQFLKTSTGKLEPGATPEAVEALLEVACEVHRRDGRRIGVKASGGVRTVVDAARYLTLADEWFAPSEAGPATFRFGASGLLDDIVHTLTGAEPAGGPARAGY